MGILDGIVEWIAEQVMAGLDLVTTSVLGALGCDMAARRTAGSWIRNCRPSALPILTRSCW